MKYAKQTKVSPDRSKAEIEKILARYGADQFVYGTDDSNNFAMLGFRYNGKLIRFKIKMPPKEDYALTPKGRKRRKEIDKITAWEQATRQKWRSMALGIKAKLELVESGIRIFEQEFLPDIVLPDGNTFSEWALPQINEIYEKKKIPALFPGK